MKPRKMATMIASLIALSPNLKFLDMMVKGPTLVSKNRKGVYCSRKVGPIGVGDGMGDGKGVGVGTGMSLLGLELTPFPSKHRSHTTTEKVMVGQCLKKTVPEDKMGQSQGRISENLPKHHLRKRSE